MNDTNLRERILCFEGGCNFRDVGGYRTHDARTVRWGMVYRTGVLTYFTENDHHALRGLGVRAICDLRRADERDREPTRWPDEQAQALCFSDGVDMPTIRALAAQQPSTAAGMFNAMVELYRLLPDWMGERIAGLFRCLAHGQAPLVVHCAAGKDRTGVAVAVLLRALGVPRDTVFEDYLLTNHSASFEAFLRTRSNAQLGLTDIHHPLLSMPPDVRDVLFSAEEAFLDAALNEIEARHGGVDRYLTHVGADREVLARVRETMLE